MEPGEDAIGSKIGTTRFNSIRIDHDIPYHNAGQIPSTNEPPRCYPISEQTLVSEHDDKEMNDKEHNDDAYERGRYHPTGISIPGSMAVAERAMERAERETRNGLLEPASSCYRNLLRSGHLVSETAPPSNLLAERAAGSGVLCLLGFLYLFWITVVLGSDEIFCSLHVLILGVSGHMQRIR
jgi:hypothetical protein